MIVDIAVLIVLFISALIAFIRGFIREVLTIAGVVCGMAAAYFWGGALAPLYRGWFGIEADPDKAEKLMGIIPYPMLADGAAYVTIFLVVVIAISILSHFLAEGLRSLGLGSVDRTFGVIFGLFRGILLLGIFYLPFHIYMDNKDKESFFEGSRTYFYLERTSAWMRGFIPEGAEEMVEEGAQQIEEGAETRDKLKELNLLEKEKTDTPEPQEPEGEGYDKSFREDMNDLFRQQRSDEVGGANE